LRRPRLSDRLPPERLPSAAPANVLLTIYMEHEGGMTSVQASFA